MGEVGDGGTEPYLLVGSPPLPGPQVCWVCLTYRPLSRDRRPISESMDDDSVYASITKANYSLFT